MWLMLEKEIASIESMLSGIKASDIEAYSKGQQTPANSGLSMDGKVATIKINGPMLPTRNPVLSYFGREHTGYDEIIGNIDKAKADGAEKIIFAMNTPGGTVNGMYDAMSAISGIEVPTEAVITGTLASAGYILGSQADTITASNELNMVGSVGVVQDFEINPNVVSITNPESPKKRLDASTEEGRKDIESTLSDVYSIVAQKIASARGETVESVNKNYGQGMVMTAKTALSKGMIDAIGVASINSAGLTAINNNTGVKTMDKNTLKAEHPDVYSAIMAEGIEAGKAECLKVVEGHLALAAASGDHDRALTDIRAMAPVDGTVMAHHTAAGIKNAQTASRGQEAPPPAGGVDPSPEAPDSYAKIKAEISAIPGVEVTF